jgi:hypothetical protein
MTVAFVAVHESVRGPTPTTSAVQKVVSYLGYCGRAAQLTGTAVLDAKPTSHSRI